MKKILLLLTVIYQVLILPESSKGQMFWNHAASFEGNINSYIKCRNTPTINLTGSFTLEAWIWPDTTGTFSKGIFAKGTNKGTTLIYGMRLEPTGRLMIATNGATRLRSKTTSLIPDRQWTHVAGTYNSSTGTFSIYINGVFDTASAISGAAPASNTDTLFIGISGSTTPFAGMMDEVRIWNKELNSLQVRNNMRTSVSAWGGWYNGMVLSLTFQRIYSNVVQFTMFDWSPNFNTCINNGVNDVDLSDDPYTYINMNNVLALGGLSDYAAGADNDYVSPTTGMTLQAWIYPVSPNNAVIIHKGTPDGTTTNYSMNIINRKLAGKINGTTFDSGDTIPLNQWSHVAFTFLRTGGMFDQSSRRMYINGIQVYNSVSFPSNIANGTDSLYIGGTPALQCFGGYIDEVRISRYAKSSVEINDSMFVPMEVSVASLYTSAAYNFDGSSYSNTTLGPMLYYRNNAFMISMFVPDPPLNQGYSMYLQKGYRMRKAFKRVPESGSFGLTTDSLAVYLDETISDINVFVALDHGSPGQVRIDLIAPDGTTQNLINENPLSQNNDGIITVFDDQAQDNIINNVYTGFGSRIKPLGSVNSSFGGKRSKGIWRLKIEDTFGSDTGRIYAWGLQFNNSSSAPKAMLCKNFIEGFYNPSANLQISDTIKCYLRNYISPFQIYDSSAALTGIDGNTYFNFTSPGLDGNIFFYAILKHRNSIETWSSQILSFEGMIAQTSYDISNDSLKAYGNNIVKTDDTPLTYSIYGGDIINDGLVNVNDITAVYNAASVFASGYVQSDVTGDNSVNVNDIVLVYNNSAQFVGKVTP